MAICNITLLAFLALKNTPLAFLTSYSYGSLNGLHQIAGYTTIICVIMHAIVYGIAPKTDNQRAVLTETAQTYGAIRAASMILTGIAAVAIRRWQSEVF